MKQLDPKAFWLFYLHSVIGALITTIFLVWLFVPQAKKTTALFDLYQIKDPAVMQFNLVARSIKFIALYWWVVPITILTIDLLISYLRYHYYRYELRDDGFRKEHGILWKKYVTIPYERIQNVDVYRNPLARLLGLSDLHIQTAGMSTGFGSYGAASEGRLPGLAPHIAEQLRDELIRRSKGNLNPQAQGV